MSVKERDKLPPGVTAFIENAADRYSDFFRALLKLDIEVSRTFCDLQKVKEYFEQYLGRILPKSLPNRNAVVKGTAEEVKWLLQASRDAEIKRASERERERGWKGEPTDEG